MDSGLDENERSVLKRLERHGWFVNVIAEDRVGSGFAYSFGLYERFRHPEIIICGLPADTMQTLVNDVGQKVSDGVRYKSGDNARDLAEGRTCTFRDVNPVVYSETFTWAVWFYGNQEFPALQLFWPDKQDRFPWDPKFDEHLRHRQLNLCELPISR